MDQVAELHANVVHTDEEIGYETSVISKLGEYTKISALDKTVARPSETVTKLTSKLEEGEYTKISALDETVAKPNETVTKPRKYVAARFQMEKEDTISKSHTEETALWRLKVLCIVLMIMVIISTATFSALIYTLMRRADVTEEKSEELLAGINLLKSKSGAQTDNGRSATTEHDDGILQRISQLETDRTSVISLIQDQSSRITQIETARSLDRDTLQTQNTRLTQLELNMTTNRFLIQSYNTSITQLEASLTSEVGTISNHSSRLMLLESDTSSSHASIEEFSSRITTLESGRENDSSTIETHGTKLLQLEMDGNSTNTTLGVLDDRLTGLEGSRSLYTRWGRTECPGNGTEMVYKGYTAGCHSTQGGGSNILCLPEEPTWGRFDDTLNLYRGYIWGAEIDIDGVSEGKVFEQNVDGQDQPCAVCMVPRSLTHMFPGRATCFPGWTMEYAGYLMTSYLDREFNKEYFCLDSDPEGVVNGEANDNQNLIYLVEAKCGSLPCPPYVDGREVACVVCSK